MASKKDPRLARAGVSGYNKPKRTPSHPTKSHVVVARSGGKIKTIRFGQQGKSRGEQSCVPHQSKSYPPQYLPQPDAEESCRW